MKGYAPGGKGMTILGQLSRIGIFSRLPSLLVTEVGTLTARCQLTFVPVPQSINGASRGSFKQDELAPFSER